MSDTEKTEEKTEKKKSKFEAPELSSPRVIYSRMFVDDSTNARGFGQGLDPDAADIKDLAASIKNLGLKEPIVVRIIEGSKLTENQRAIIGLDENDKPQEWYAKVVAGARRYYAIGKIIAETPKAFKEGVPVSVEDGKLSASDEFFAMMAENIDRENLTPAEQADAIYRARKTMGLASKDIHAKIPKLSPGYISHLFGLRSKLSEKAWAAFANGEIPFDVARDIKEAGDHDAQDKVLTKVLKHVEDTGQAGKKKKKGLKAVARAAAKGDGDSAPAILRPKMSDLKAKLAEYEEGAANAYDKGVRNALRWATGAKKRLATKAD